MPTVVRLMSEHWLEPADEDLVRRSWSAPGFELWFLALAGGEPAGVAICKTHPGDSGLEKVVE